jgi:uncharacterized protein YjbI with pentapeptide repeats
MQKKKPAFPTTQKAPPSRRRGTQSTRSSQAPQTPPTQHHLSVPQTPEEWHAHWKAQGQPWRTEPEINAQRQEELAKRRAVGPDEENRIYPFGGMKLTRADVEWLLAAHENGCGPVDWSDESQREREGLDLRGANLRGSGVRPVNLVGLPLARLVGGLDIDAWIAMAAADEKMEHIIVSLTGADLRGAHLEGAELGGAHLMGTNLSEAHLEEANLAGTQLEKADLSEAHLKGANLYMAHLEGAHLFGIDLEEANLNGAHLEKANLCQAQLTGSHSSGAQLTEAFLSLADLERADLSETYLERADLSETYLVKTNLSGAHLEGTNLNRAHLEGANLSGAYLTRVILKDVVLGDNNHVGPSLAACRRERSRDLARC